MTRLERAVIRVTGLIDNRTRRPIVIRLRAGGKMIDFWIKGDRRRDKLYSIGVEACFIAAARIKADDIKRRKAEEKRQRRLTRQGKVG